MHTILLVNFTLEQSTMELSNMNIDEMASYMQNTVKRLANNVDSVAELRDAAQELLGNMEGVSVVPVIRVEYVSLLQNDTVMYLYFDKFQDYLCTDLLEHSSTHSYFLHAYNVGEVVRDRDVHYTKLKAFINESVADISELRRASFALRCTFTFLSKGKNEGKQDAEVSMLIEDSDVQVNTSKVQSGQSYMYGEGA